jgi:hypothetical protein
LRRESLTPAERRLRGQLASHESWANTKDRTARTAPARAALDQKFLDQAGGDPKRAESLRKAYYARLAFESAKARKAKSQARCESLDGGGSDAAAKKRTTPVEGTGAAPKNTVDAGADLIITPDAPDPFCGRCGGTAGPEGAWCDNCIRTCKEYTQQLDLQRFTELNTEPLEWAAVFYARVGIPVFPLMPGKKVPATKHGKDDATTDLRVIRSWWRRNPNHNIGLVCGVIFDALSCGVASGTSMV